MLCYSVERLGPGLLATWNLSGIKVYTSPYPFRVSNISAVHYHLIYILNGGDLFLFLRSFFIFAYGLRLFGMLDLVAPKCLCCVSIVDQ